MTYCVFEIIIITFDKMENDYLHARTKGSLGVVISKECAIETIEKLNNKYGNRYKGWDGNTYPYYEYREINAFNENHLNEYGTVNR